MASFRSPVFGDTIANRVSKETSVLATGGFFSLHAESRCQGSCNYISHS